MSFVKPITGQHITTKVGMESADLGIPRWDSQRGANAVMFGDNFTELRMQGEWQSPSIVMYDNDYEVLGIPTTAGIASEGNRRQLWKYPHNNVEYSTILPTDFIRVNGVWYVAAMVTQGLGNELRTVFWQSHNLVDWERTDPYVRFDHPSHPPRVMLTFDQIGDVVWIFSTNGLRRDQDIWLWSCDADEFPHGEWHDVGMVLPGRYGELCFRHIQGHSVLSFFDAGAYRQTALTVPDPTGDWTQANACHYAFGEQVPQLYGGYITPASKLNEPDGMQFLVSQWNTLSGNNDPYHVLLFEDTLEAKGPLVVAPTPEPVSPPVPVPVPTPTPPTGDQMSPQELYELLLRELSASGAVTITTPEGDKLTMREAVAQIFDKERGWHRMDGRPRHPKDSDDQLGHALSSRAETLFTQACVVAVADHLGIDTRNIYHQVKRSLG